MSAELETMKAVAEHAAQSASFIDTLGLNWKLFIAQLVNFSVIVFVLWRWAYKPLVKLMDDRTKKIEQGLHDAQRTARELEQLEKTREVTIRESKHEAQRVVETSMHAAEKLREDMLAKAHVDVEKVVADAKVQIAAEKTIMLQEVKEHIATLVIAATEKILQEKIDGKKDKEFVEATVRNLNI